MTETRISRAADLPALKALWHAAFGDAPEEIDVFFARYWRPERTLVLTADGAARAMTTWFDMPLVTAAGRSVPGAYLYAVAAEQAYRGRGFAAALLDFAAEHLSRQGFAALTTVPSGPSLFDFYARRGFETQFFQTRWEHRSGGAPAVPLVPVDASEYGRLREKRLAGTAHVSCGPAALDWLAETCRRSGGGLCRVGTDGCACAERWGGELTVKELLVDDGMQGPALDALLARYAAPVCTVRAPRAPGGQVVPFAMTRWLVPPPPGGREKGYFGPAFD